MTDCSPDSDFDEVYDWRQEGNTHSRAEDLEENGDSLMDLLDSMEIDQAYSQQEIKVPMLSNSNSKFNFKLRPSQANNPFIPTGASKKRSSFTPESMMPDLPEGPIRPSPYQKMIQDAAKKQKEAQMLFRSMSAASPISPVSPSLAIPKRGNSLLSPTDKSPFADLILRRPISPLQRNRSPVYDEVSARQERLASLGIFDVIPKSKPPPQEVRRASLKSFSTPLHQKPIMLEKDIREITGPQLISTSSKMQTVPISEILKDLKASGRLVEDEKRKKKNYFRRQI